MPTENIFQEAFEKVVPQKVIGIRAHDSAVRKTYIASLFYEMRGIICAHQKELPNKVTVELLPVNQTPNEICVRHGDAEADGKQPILFSLLVDFYFDDGAELKIFKKPGVYEQMIDEDRATSIALGKSDAGLAEKHAKYLGEWMTEKLRPVLHPDRAAPAEPRL